MPTYRNVRTGRVVEVPDEAPTRTNRPKRHKQWSAKIGQMDRSKRWERIDGDPVGEPERPAPNASRPTWDAYAEHVGVHAPGELPNKQAVIDAVDELVEDDDE